MLSENTTAGLAKYLPTPYKKRRYYTKKELLLHNTPNDIWVSFFEDVYDLTALVQLHRLDPHVDALITVAGSDITRWFDHKTKSPKKCTDQSGQCQFYTPEGEYLHLRLENDAMTIPWWKNQEYLIGRLSSRPQKVRIINTLSDTEDILEVPCEETIAQILDRYEAINSHAKSYTWKRKDVVLNMNATLAENGIIDETALYETLQVPPEQQYVPAIHLRFNDDLTCQ